jgi:hypothetical protein
MDRKGRKVNMTIVLEKSMGANLSVYGNKQGDHWGVKNLLDNWKKNWVEY